MKNKTWNSNNYYDNKNNANPEKQLLKKMFEDMMAKRVRLRSKEDVLIGTLMEMEEWLKENNEPGPFPLGDSIDFAGMKAYYDKFCIDIATLSAHPQEFRIYNPDTALMFKLVFSEYLQ